MKSIYLIESGVPVVAMVEMEKPIPYVHTNGWDRTTADLLEYEQHLATATRHEVIGKIPDEWVVGEVVDVELQHQAYLGIEDCVHYFQDITPENQTTQTRRIVAKPLISPEKHTNPKVTEIRERWKAEKEKPLSLNLPNLENVLNSPNPTLEKEVTALMDKLDEDNKPILTKECICNYMDAICPIHDVAGIPLDQPTDPNACAFPNCGCEPKDCVKEDKCDCEECKQEKPLPVGEEKELQDLASAISIKTIKDIQDAEDELESLAIWISPDGTIPDGFRTREILLSIKEKYTRK